MRSRWAADTVGRMPTAYRIRVGGSLDASWSDRLGGLSVGHLTGPKGEPETMLEGPLEDDAALAGVFDVLFELMVPILSAERLDESEARVREERA